MNEKVQELIKETIVELVKTIDTSAAIEEERIENVGDDQEIFTINLSTESPNLLIGQYGSNLQCLQHLAGIIVRRKALGWDFTDVDENDIKFNIDVNNYKKQKKESLVKLVDTIASQVVYNKNSVALRPMSGYERKIVHMEIASRKNLTTESIGEDLMRRVVIKYVEE